MDRVLNNRKALLALVFAAAVLAFLPTLRNGFVDYDDNSYVTGNAIVRSGLTWHSIRWALTTSYFANWHPLTWLAHMLDCQIFGVRAWGHHLVSLLLHAGVAVLVFSFVEEASGDRLRSLAVAVLFALHPLRVESVAWVSERKDLLCALFFLLACRAHLRRVRRGSTGTWVAVFTALSLAAKPMAVTLPLVLLLLDFWPLRRALSFRLLLEKAPIFILAAAGAVMTMLAQVASGAVAKFPLADRLGNVAINVVRYLRLTAWPHPLLPLYLLTPPQPLLVAAAVVAVLALTAGALLLWRKKPAVTFGWLWFLVVLLPVLGLVQAGAQAVADRYTYLPHVGLFVALAFLLPDFAPRRLLLPVAAALAVVSFIQVGYWKGSEELFGRVLAYEPKNPVATLTFGYVRLQQGRLQEAEKYLRESLSVTSSASGYVDLGKVLIEEGRTEEALIMYQRAWRLSPGDTAVAFWYGHALMHAHRTGEAIAQYRLVAQIDPDYPGLARALGLALDMAGHSAEALPMLRRATKEQPNDAAAHAILGTALARAKQFEEATHEFERALELQPDYPGARQALQYAREDAAQAQRH